MAKGFSVGMISLGCPKNQVDGEALLAKLSQAGYNIVNTIEASDVMIVNTCGFIEDAKTEAIETILEVAQYKEAGLISAIVVTGCLAERYQDEILKEMPEVDAVIGIGANADIVKVCDKALCGIKTSSYPNKCYLPLDGERVLSTPSHWAYLKISDGCDNKCSYCAIPGIRGRFRSRDMDSVVDEARLLASKGVKELILVAQDTTKYGQDLYGEYSLDRLLKRLVKIDGIEWIRLFYCYPQRITDSLIETIAAEEKICNYIDIPLQHADKNVLKSMNRVGDAEEYKALIEKMRKAIPDLALRTTFMVGFPGETEEQFANLSDFVKEVKFDKMGCFAFSPEEGTPAAKMEHPDEETAARRVEIVCEIQSRIMDECNDARIGTTMEVLCEGFDPETDRYFGRTYADSPDIDGRVLFTAQEPVQIGDFVQVRIDGVSDGDLTGREEEK